MSHPSISIRRFSVAKRPLGFLAVWCCCLMGAALHAADPDITSDLVLRMTMDQTSGTEVEDIAGDHPGSFNDSPTWVTSGKIDGAIEFDGTDDWVSGSDADDLDDTAVFTLALWFRADDTTGIQGLMSKRVNHNNNYAWGAYLDGSALKVDIEGNDDRFAINSTISANTWYHLVIVYDGNLSAANRVKVYLDGTLDITASESSTSISNHSSGFCIGRLCSNSSSFLDGKLDEIRVYRRALSSDDVDELYDFTGPIMAADTYRHLRLTVSKLASTGFEGRFTDVDHLEGTTEHPTTAMTSNTSGGMVASASVDNANAYKAFDSSGSSYWAVGNGDLPATLSLDFGSGNEFAPTGIDLDCTQGFRCPDDFQVHGSNDGSTWTLLTDVTGFGGEGRHTFPTAVRDVYVVEGTTQLVESAPGVLANDDLPGEGTMVAELIDGPDNGTLALENDGSFTYDADSGFSGEDSFTYRAINDTHSAEATVVLRVVGGDIEMSMTTDSNARGVLKPGGDSFGLDSGVGEELTVEVPWTTAATDVTLTQPGSAGEVYFGATGTDTTKVVTTSGGTPNTATVVVRHSTTSSELGDVEIHASGGGKTGDIFATAMELAISPKCAYLADMRPVTQTLSVTPAIEGITFDTESHLIAGSTASATTLASLGVDGATDTDGQTTATTVAQEFAAYVFTWFFLERDTSATTEEPKEGSDTSNEICNGTKDGPDSPGTTDDDDDYACPSGTKEDTPHSVDLSDGEKKLFQTDSRIRGRGLHWEFRRAYRSGARRGSLGRNDIGEHWTYRYADDYLVKDGTGDDDASNYVHFLDGHSGYAFVNTATDTWEGPNQRLTQLRLLSSGDFEVRYPNGLTKTYHGFGTGVDAKGRLKAMEDRVGNEMTFHYEEIDPDGTASNGDEKQVLAFVIDTLGREIRYQYYAATAQTVGGRDVTIVETGTGARGRLARVVDFKGDMDFSDNDTSEDFANQTNNRTLHFDYDSEGNLVRVSSPVVSGTPTGNDFSSGRTTRYQYITESNRGGLSQSAWDALSQDEQDVLLHHLQRVWWPNEVQNTPGSDPADSEAVVVIGYETDNTDPFFGFATSYEFGGQNDNGVPSGGTITYTWTDLNPDRDMPGNVSTNPVLLIKEDSLKVEVNDRNGHDAEYVYGGGRMLLDYKEFTEGLRTGEPSSFDLARTHNQDRLLKKLTLPEGNTIERTYNENADDRFQQANMIRIVRTPDVTRGGDQDKIETVIVYEPIYNRPCMVVSPRGADTANNDFTAPIADPIDRTITDPYDAAKTLDLRYATIEYFDYQESTTFADDWSETSASPLAGQTVDSEEVLATEVLLLREVGLPETTAGVQELRQRLDDNLTNLALGDLNADGNTDPVIQGNIVRSVHGSSVLQDTAHQATLESLMDSGDEIDETAAPSAGGPGETASADELQTQYVLREYNEFGQPTVIKNAEGNVTTLEYFAENDPDGDGTTTPTPADGRTLDTADGGYLKERLRDTTRDATKSNNDTGPSVTDITVSFTYDDVGNPITRTNARGIRDDYFVNELNERIRTERAADISGADTASPSDPLANGNGLQAFAYQARRFLDFNGNVVLSQTEDRGDTSSTDGLNLGTLPSQATDTTPGLSSADGAGGTAYVDTLRLYDRLDNRIESRAEVDDTTGSLDTQYRYDANQNPVLTISPEGNADGAVYDERDLLFQTIKGVATRPSDGLYATGDPTTFDRPGGSGTTASTFTRNYDKNQNLIEFVDADDTDSDTNNNSAIAGDGDVTTHTYDGYDRRKTTEDADGNVTTRVYDPENNVVRVIRDGDPVDDVVGDGNNKTLEVTETIFDNRNRVVARHRVLFETPDVTTTRTITLTDTATMDSIAPYLADASSDTATVPGSTGITVIGRISTLQEYDRLHRRTFAVEDDLDVTRLDYDGANRQVKSEDSDLANTWSGTAFVPGNLSGNTVERAYDDQDNVIEQLETDVTALANVADEEFRTTNIYDSLDRLELTADNVGQASDRRYDSRSNLVAQADAVGASASGRTINRRGLGSTASVNINDFGNVIRNRYDGQSRKLEEEAILTASGTGDGTNIGADREGVLGTTPTPDTNQSGDGLASTYYAWDDNSQLLALRDDNGNTTGYIFDNQNRQLTERKGLAETGTTFTLTGGDSGAFNVSLRGAATTPVDTETAGTDIDKEYDPDSNVTQITDEATNDIDCTYDALNRKKTCTITRATGFLGTTSQTTKYDGLSRKTECFDNNDPTPTTDDVTCEYRFDSLSRTIEESQQIGSTGVIRTVSCDYDINTAGAEYQCASTVYPDNRRVDSDFDRLDRLLERRDNGQGSAIGSIDYIGKWRVAVLTYQNDTRLTHIGQSGGQNADVGFDSLRRTIDHRWESFTPGTTPLGNGTALVHFGYGFDRRNNKLREEKFHAAGDSEVYAYDSIYRVIDFDRGTLNAGKTAIATPTATAGALQAQDWTLDGVHNWNANTHTTGGTGSTENRDHTDFNEINAVTGTPYGGKPTRTDAHDKNGNLTDDGTLSYEWDAKNRLKKVTRKSDSKVIAEYVYDCDNRRMEKTISNGGITGSTPNGTTRYYYHGWQVLQEEDGSDAVQRQYVYGNYIDEPWTLDDRSGGQSVGDLNDGSGSDRQFYHCNTQYSIHALSDETGALSEGYQYDAYGRQYVYTPGTNGTIDWGGDDVITANGASGVDNEYMYTGRRFNPELENYYFRNRYYDSLRGRFVGRDSTKSDGPNLYSNYFPTYGIDPFGWEFNIVAPGVSMLPNVQNQQSDYMQTAGEDMFGNGQFTQEGSFLSMGGAIVSVGLLSWWDSVRVGDRISREMRDSRDCCFNILSHSQGVRNSLEGIYRYAKRYCPSDCSGPNMFCDPSGTEQICCDYIRVNLVAVAPKVALTYYQKVKNQIDRHCPKIDLNIFVIFDSKDWKIPKAGGPPSWLQGGNYQAGASGVDKELEVNSGHFWAHFYYEHMAPSSSFRSAKRWFADCDEPTPPPPPPINFDEF